MKQYGANASQMCLAVKWKYEMKIWYENIKRQAGADITGQLQVGPMLYTLYIDINVRVVKMLHTDNKQQITKWIQRPSKRRSYVTPGGAFQ